MTDTYKMRFIDSAGDTWVNVAAEPETPTLTRFIGSWRYPVATTVRGVELWQGDDLCLNAQNLATTTHVAAGSELIIQVDLQHLPNQVDLWQFSAETPPNFQTVEEAQAWLDARA